MPADADLEHRIAQAQSEAKHASAQYDMEVTRQSADLLKTLMRKTVEARFQVLADANLALIPAHRRELVRSIRSTASTRPAIAVATASRWELFRSRLRYRTFFIGVAAASTATVIVLVVAAIWNTPKQMVTIVAGQPFMARETEPDGRISTVRLDPGANYVLARIVGSDGELRVWERETGYGTISVPLTALRAAN